MAAAARESFVLLGLLVLVLLLRPSRRQLRGLGRRGGGRRLGSRGFRLPTGVASARRLCGVVWLLVAAGEPLPVESVLKLPKLCLKTGDDSRCAARSLGDRIVCRKEYVPHYRNEYRTARTVVFCRLSERLLRPQEILSLFPSVRKLVVAGGNVTGFLADFPPSPYLESLVLRDLLLEEVPPTLVTSLSRLKLLDLRGNRLTDLGPEIVSGHPSLSTVLLAENPWDCTSDLTWTLEPRVAHKLGDLADALCGSRSYPGKQVASVMYLLRAMRSECPQDICSCSMLNIVRDADAGYLVPVIGVDCSGRGLTRFPERLPRNTTTLILKGNAIADLSPLAEDSKYSDVADVYLDGNEVADASVLEGALWLTKFRVFSLRGNRLREIPTYAFDNALERNANAAEIYLGDNPWNCDCAFTSEFQHLLIKYRSLVKDEREVRCVDLEAGSDARLPVLDVSVGSVCASASVGPNPADAASVVLGLLILLLLGKLIYDCWTFKRTGKLPWIVAKMP